MNIICKMCDIYKVFFIFEMVFEEVYGILLNEVMVLCVLCEVGKEIILIVIVEWMEMVLLYMLKVICVVEDKGFIWWVLGEVDKC